MMYRSNLEKANPINGKQQSENRRVQDFNLVLWHDWHLNADKCTPCQPICIQNPAMLVSHVDRALRGTNLPTFLTKKRIDL